MTYSFTEKKRIRRSFSKVRLPRRAAEMPPLLDAQIQSYRGLLQADAASSERKYQGLQAAFETVFPIVSSNGNCRLEFLGYDLERPQFTVRECKERGLTYRAKILARIRMVFLEKDGKTIKEAREHPVHMGEVPLMAVAEDREPFPQIPKKEKDWQEEFFFWQYYFAKRTQVGSFILNGTERVVVGQLHRSPGVFFEHDFGRSTLSGKVIYSARVIPYNGSWLDFEFDQRDFVYFRIDRRRKMPVTTLLKVYGYSDEDILAEFYDFEGFRLGGESGKAEYQLDARFLRSATLPFDLTGADGNIIVRKDSRIKAADLRKLGEADWRFHPVPDEFLNGRRLAKTIIDESTGEIIAHPNDEINGDLLGRMRAAGIAQIEAIYTNEFDCGPYISRTMASDDKLDQGGARIAVYRMLRPGDPPNAEVVNAYFENLFASPDRYNLSAVGRMKLNRRLDAGLNAALPKGAPENPPRPEMEYRVVIRKMDKGESVRKRLVQNLRAIEGWSDEAAAEFTVDTYRYQTQKSQKIVRPVQENMANREDAVALACRVAGGDSSKAKLLAEISRDGTFYKEGIEVAVEEQRTLSREDILQVVKVMVHLRNGKGRADDIDSLGNRRVRSVGEFVQNHFQAGLLRVERAIRDRLSQAETENLTPHELISAKTIKAAVMEFFIGSQLSQFMDQTNPLSEVTHKRRISALGPGGLMRERAGFEVRDVHPTHYGRVCPIETPEGPNIGLINSMALYSRVNRFGFLETAYRVVKDGRAMDDIVYLSAIEEAGFVVAQANSRVDEDGNFTDAVISCRKDGEFILSPPGEVDYMDVAPAQIASVAAAMIPFLEHDDSNRALMGSNMQRQAVPCLKPDCPLVGTGVERKVAEDSRAVLSARRGGTVDYVDAARIVIRVREEEVDSDDPDDVGVDIYRPTKFTRSNQNTIVHQQPIVQEGHIVAAGDVIADGAATDLGEIALGQNLLVAFLPWNGFNYEDSILISERVVAEERFSSIHIEEHIIRARETKIGPEEITRDIPNQSEQTTANLDDSGIVHIGTEVHPDDILVGKVTPKSERPQTPEEKLLRAIFGDKASDVKDTSLRLPPGASGTVMDVKVFTAPGVDRDARAEDIIARELEKHAKDLRDTLRIQQDGAIERIRGFVTGRLAKRTVGDSIKDGVKITKTALAALTREQWFELRVADEKINDQIERLGKKLAGEKDAQEKRRADERIKFTKGDELEQGVLKMVKVYVAIKRNLQVGDKMAGRHGNKGVVSKIVPVEDMPYLADGTSVDIVLNPLGVPSRMNVGQILETHLGLVAKTFGDGIGKLLAKESAKQVDEIRRYLESVYNPDGIVRADLSQFSDAELLEMARHLSGGVPFASPIFDGATESEIKNLLSEVGHSSSGQMAIYDGRTGEAFDRPVTVGYAYILKLHHLVDDKMHARSTGPYSLVTQQPLGGKAQQGGQRFGEMEVWALEAYGAAYTLCEMLTAKSDDIAGRAKMYDNIVSGDFRLESEVPESFNVLVHEIRALGIDMDFE